MANQPTTGIRVIITGATGMVGEGVLHECLQHDAIKDVLVINRKPCGVVHPKLQEIIHTNFFDITSLREKLTGFDACFFCLGVSSVGMQEPEYYRLTYTLTMHVAETLADINSSMTFCYISGAGTDSTENGRSMWARVKGKTENDLMKLPFSKVYNFRPGILQPTKGLKNTLRLYTYLGWLIPVIKLLSPGAVTTLQQLGIAMIKAATLGYHQPVLEVKDIQALANK